MSSQAFSIWGSRFSDEGGQNLVSYLSRKDTAEVDVGDILAVAGKALPYIPPNRLTFDKALGRGTSFQVNREVYSKPGYSGYYVAVKYLQTSTDSTFERRRRYAAVLREVRVLTHLALRGNACVMPALGYGWQSDRLEGAQPYLVVDYSDHGTLPQYLRRCKIPLHERIELAIDIASALQSLHACKIIHGDVKPENIIVYDHGGDLPERPQAAKLADFGCSIFELDFKQGSDVYYLGTPKYNAPEINGRVGSQVEAYDSSIVAFALADVYSYGLFLWEVLKNGQDYLDPSWFRDGEDGGDCITRICATEVDGILERASSFYDNELATNKTSTFPDTLKQALALALRDRRSLRGSMDEIFHVLTTEFG
ncbi:kinase-like protein [Amniculicola lignicola CBS 123094]|uniref:Kinase-like protein n=1 Tax=Amniculicola lignicola CBS 123094 TaxID=1392246 RepID=A0A6A5WBB2_9PLEO|nr:kinase-like protein [Amniculicola lignicola CBS 123094]